MFRCVIIWLIWLEHKRYFALNEVFSRTLLKAPVLQQRSSRDDASWSLSHSVATSLPIVWTYSLSVRHSRRSLSLCLPWRWSDLRPSVIWQACHSDDFLSLRPATLVKASLQPLQSQKRAVRRAPSTPRCLVRSWHGSGGIQTLRKRTSGRQRSTFGTKHDG